MIRNASPVVALLMVGLLSACNDEPPQARRYDDVVSLRDAAIDAGMDCDLDYWEITPLGYGQCGRALIRIYPDDVDPSYAAQQSANHIFQQAVDENFRTDHDDDLVLVGPNWSIFTPDAWDVQESLGGEVLVGSLS